LDEESIFPNASDKTLLDKLNKNCASDKHFQVSDVKQGQNGFTVVHYAGNVNYDVTGFLDKNTDTLFIDLKMMLQQSKDQFLAKLFPPETQSKQRPPTAAIQFKVRVHGNISASTNSYVYVPAGTSRLPGEYFNGMPPSLHSLHST
jgi:myosin heavy subunit